MSNVILKKVRACLRGRLRSGTGVEQAGVRPGRRDRLPAGSESLSQMSGNGRNADVVLKPKCTIVKVLRCCFLLALGLIN